MRSSEGLSMLISELVKLPSETEYVEFKVNNSDPNAIGKYISSLSNSAALHQRDRAYLVWGIEDGTHKISGTNFNPLTSKKGQEDLESWLRKMLDSSVDFTFHLHEEQGVSLVILEIDPALANPVKFNNIAYIRIGSYTKPLDKHPEKERKLWSVLSTATFEKRRALEDVNEEEITKFINYSSYFDLLRQPLPESRETIINDLKHERIILRQDNGLWSITNLGALLFAKKLNDFPSVKRKAVRVVLYQDNNRLNTLREREFSEGYAVKFEDIVEFIMTIVPTNEVIEKALRETKPMYPEIAIRELVANALIHQDLSILGSSPIIEIFDSRIEICNPGEPLIETDKLLNAPPRSRNEQLGSLMRRLGVCEERGSGIDKVIAAIEEYQLPAPKFELDGNSMRATLYAHKLLKDMEPDDKIRACYQHACLQHANGEPLTNNSLRERFGIEKKNAATASRLIKDAVDAKVIKPHGEFESKRYSKYKPYWA